MQAGGTLQVAGRFVTAVIAMIGAVALVSVFALALGPAPAAADTCPDKETMLPAKGDDPDPPYQCAQMNSSENKKLSAWETKTWSSSPGAGYYNKTTCKYKDNSNVDITGYDAGYGAGSYSVSATNWDTDKSHYFAAGVLWATGNVEDDGYSSGCADDNEDGDIENSILDLTSLSLSNVPSTATVGQEVRLTTTLSPSDAYGDLLLIANETPAAVGHIYSSKEGTGTTTWTPYQAGTVELQAFYYLDVGYFTIGDHRVSCPSTGKTCGSTAAASNTAKLTVYEASSSRAAKRAAPTPGPLGLPETLRAPAEGADVPVPSASRNVGLVTRERTRKMPARLSLRCGKGRMPMYAEALTRRPGDPLVRFHGSEARVVANKALRGHRVTLQLSCRKRNAKLLAGRHLILGTKRADAVGTPRPESGIFGGPGPDRISVNDQGSFAHGGRQGDRIEVSAPDGVATGDPGRDVLKATTHRRSLLLGGQDPDKLVGAHGATRINAFDGAGGDLVICRGKANLVLADPGDEVQGQCGVVQRRGG